MAVPFRHGGGRGGAENVRSLKAERRRYLKRIGGVKHRTSRLGIEMKSVPLD